MEIKKTSSGVIKTFAQVIFVVGIIVTTLSAIGLVIGGWQYAKIHQVQAMFALSIVGAVILLVVGILLLIVERAFLFSYAEIAEDMREVRNILAQRDSNT
ncbi:MAG: hypothetical protein LIR25_05655 [bacterium]|nr:hypothetical protein [bacterium]